MTSKIKNTTLICGLVLIVCLVLGVFLTTTPINMAYAAVDELTTGNYDNEFVVTDTADEVLAEFQYSVINDTECSVRITNKTTATKAIIPNTAEIDGKEYTITEVAANGFMSATKLVRVKLPVNIKKIGNMAFANCTALKRVNMANVVEIGNNAFNKCTQLERLIIPESVNIIGSTILRNCNAKVYVRAAIDGENWAVNWNTGNSNTDIDYSSTYVEPLELETVYSKIARSATPDLLGYTVAGGQPRSDTFYVIEENNIFIPNLYNGEYILSIDSRAFEGLSCEKFIIEYSSQDLFVDSNTFEFFECNELIINRNITFYNSQTGETSDNIFTGSMIQKIALPDTITEIPLAMFAGCEYLTNIFFITPQFIDKRQDELKIIDNIVEKLPENEKEGIVHLTQSETLQTIGESAFMGTVSIREIHIYDNVKNFEASIFADWTEGQKIFIHNENINMSEANGYNWHPQWYLDVPIDNINYDAKYYTITFHYDNGTNETVVKDVKFGEKIGEMPVPTAQYKVHYAWADENSETWTADDIYNIERNLDLYACYAAYHFLVIYDANKPIDANDPVVGTMQPTIFAASDYQLQKLAPIEYGIRGWDFDKWYIIVDDIKLTFKDEEAILIIDVLEKLGLEIYDGMYISLCATWELHKYTIDYKVGDGTNPSENPPFYTVNSELEFLPPIREGYTCYWEPAKIEKGTAIESLEVTAHYTPNGEHIIIYELNGGTNNSFNEITYRTGENKILHDPIRDAYSFVGWRLKGTVNTFVTNLKDYDKDITLEAIWVLTGRKYDMPTNATTLTVSDSYSAVEIQHVSNAIEIIVTPNVRQLYLYSNSNLIHSVRLTVQRGRNSDFSLVLNNIEMCSTNAEYATITMQDSRSLIITAYNNCVIRGAVGASGKRGGLLDVMSGIGNDGTAGSEGGVAIDCKYLTICSPITILGGDGGVGGTGYSGRIGGNGGMGGDGNYAIIAQRVTIRSSDITIRGGQGGQGGHGGSGWTSVDIGKGAFGGMGSLAMSTSTLEIESPVIEGKNDYENITIAQGARGKKGVNGDEFHEVIM